MTRLPTAVPRPGARRGAGVLAAACLAALACRAAAEPPVEPPPSEPCAVAPARAGAGHVLLWYLPNRVLDLLDCVRLRLRAGPGLALEARATCYAANFAGTYDAWYAGLPGPRGAPGWPRLAGRESLRGLIVMGVDATDDSPHPPRVSDTELTVSAQCLAAGAAVGFDPRELGDFLAGWLTLDFRGDDR